MKIYKVIKDNTFNGDDVNIVFDIAAVASNKNSNQPAQMADWREIRTENNQ